MQKSSMKRKALLSALVVAAMATQSAAAVFAEVPGNSADLSDFDMFVPVFGETSEFGYQSVTYLDKNGNEVNFNLIPENKDNVFANKALPASYNLVDYGLVTSVKNQADTGTCWAHAALGAAESSLIKDGLASKKTDFSEAHLVWFSQGLNTEASDPLYGDPAGIGTKCYDYGGNNSWAVGALSSWMGTANEGSYANVTKRPQIDQSKRYDSTFHLQKSVSFDPSDRASIKSYLMSNGALTIAYCHDFASSYYNESKYAYYYNGSADSNHAITLVGWDDNFNKSNFKIAPPGNGAWIVKGSWGADYGKDGYYYISYYDTSLCEIASMELEKTDNYGKVYQHSLRQYASLSANQNASDKRITGASVFTSTSGNPLTAVSFYTAEASVPYTISIYKDVAANNPMSGTLLYSQTGKASYAGYHTIKLNKEVVVPKKSRFSVCVSLEKEYSAFWLDSNGKANGNSFICIGKGTASSKWYDSVDTWGLDTAIKAFTKGTAVEKPSITGTAPGDYKVKIAWNALAGAEMYRVYTYDGTNYTRQFTCDGTRTSATVSNLEAGKKYGFVVSAKVNGAWTDYSDKADLVYATPTGAPKPTIVAAKPGDYKVKLEWKAISGAEMYRVYTYENGTYTRKFTCLGSRNVATVTSLVSGVKVGFVVSAKVNGTWTDYSNTADLVYATPTGTPAPVITGIMPGDSKVKVAWYAPKGAEMYRVYTCENGVYTRQFTCDSSRTVATVSNLKNGKEYAFVVSAKINGTWTDYTAPELLVYATPTV